MYKAHTCTIHISIRYLYMNTFNNGSTNLTLFIHRACAQYEYYFTFLLDVFFF